MKSNLNDFTHFILERVNIKKDMRVLDIGCGTGGVCLMLQEYIGSKGEIIGVDNDRQVITAAKTYVNQENITFIHADINKLPDNMGEFDIIIGRQVLMYQDDIDIITKLKKILKKDGKLVFIENDYNIPENQEDFQYHLQFLRYYTECMKKEGINTSIGSQLYSLFKKNDLKIEYLSSSLTLESKETDSSLLWLFDNIVQRVLEQDILDENFDFSKLREKMQSEIDESDSMFIKNINYAIIGLKK